MPAVKPEVLSDRERDVLLGVRDEKTYPEIAFALKVSHETVKTYAKRLRAKLGVTTKVGLALWAAEHMPKE